MSNVIIQIWRHIVIMTSQARDMKFLMMDSGSLGMVSYLSVMQL